MDGARRARQPVGVAHGDREEPRARSSCGASAPRAPSRPRSRRLLETEWTLAPADRRGVRGAHDPRRAAAHDVLLLPSAARGRGAGRAHPQHPLRLRRERDRGGVPHGPRRHREAHRARQEGPRQREAAVRSRPTPSSRRGSSTVRRALYLLFNEGYHGASAESAVRVELCDEAMRLTAMLSRAPARGRRPRPTRSRRLMCLHAARLAGAYSTRPASSAALARPGPIPLGRVASSRRGSRSSSARRPATTLTAYHVEAAIAVGARERAQPWPRRIGPPIVALYDRLMAIAASPVVALNRAHRDRPARRRRDGIEALRAIADLDRLVRYPFYPARSPSSSSARRPRRRARPLPIGVRVRAQSDGAAVPGRTDPRIVFALSADQNGPVTYQIKRAWNTKSTKASGQIETPRQSQTACNRHARVAPPAFGGRRPRAASPPATLAQRAKNHC